MTNRRSLVSLVIGLLWLSTSSYASGQEQAESPILLSGMSVSQGSEVEDNHPLNLNDEILIRLLYRVAKVSERNFVKFSKYSSEISITDALTQPRKFRFWVFKLTGKVAGVKKLSIPNADSDDGLKFCYAIDINTEDDEKIRLLARSIPKTWTENTALNQPVECHGFFYGLIVPTADGTDEDARGLFLTNRISWRPIDENAELGVGPSQVLLASQGVDIGLLDFVRKQNTKSLGADDTDCFFQMLAASRKITVADMPGGYVGFVDLMQNPKEHFADHVIVEGRVRRCVPVQIDDPGTRELLGANQYYELDMFIHLGDQKIVVKNSPDSSLEYRQRFPVTVCIAELPDGMTENDIQDKFVEVHGFFYRFWKYQSEFTDQGDGQGGQVSPLVIGLAPAVLSPRAFILDRFLMFILLGLIVGVIALVWFFRWRKQDSPTGKSSSRKQLPETVDLSTFDSE